MDEDRPFGESVKRDEPAPSPAERERRRRKMQAAAAEARAIVQERAERSMALDLVDGMLASSPDFASSAMARRDELLAAGATGREIEDEMIGMAAAGLAEHAGPVLTPEEFNEKLDRP